MLQELHVKNLALIEEANVEFGKNLNILTGETGAGKSILLGSINLCLGKRASKDLIKDENKETLVELVFQGEDDNIIIKRSIGKDKSYAKVNGENVTLNELKEITSKLIDIYGQHDSETLRDDKQHINFLDTFCKNKIKNAKEDVDKKYTEYKKAIEHLKDFQLDEGMRLRELDLLRYEVKEIEEANLKEGEEEELANKYKIYSSSQDIIQGMNNAKEILEEANIQRAQSEIKKASKLDHELDDIEKSIKDADSIISDVIRELDSKMSNYEINEEEFYNIEKRLELVRSITMKHGGSIEKTLESLHEKSNRLKELENYDKEKDKANREVTLKEKELCDACEKLSSLRKINANEFENKLIEELNDLGFSEVKFEIEFDKKNEYTRNGFDDVTFMVSLNVGEKLKPLTEIASGGELSRIMLSIKTILADLDNTNTLIFDEIDQGISGITAAKVANKLKKIAKNRQVLCITHLPQIAAKASSHFEILKTVKDGKTLTKIKALDEDGQIKEIARLLSGGKITEKAIENARDLRK